MPKGDRSILKADLEDGYTKLSNLILEVLSIAKLSGIQKGICLYLFRRSYAWNTKQARITLDEFAHACDSSRSYISQQLKTLVEGRVIIRSDYNPGKVPLYSFNTRVSQWQKGLVNAEQLRKNNTEGLYKYETDGFSKSRTLQVPSVPMDTDAGILPKEPSKERSKESTTTTVPSTVQGTPEITQDPSSSSNIFKFYEENMGLLSPLVAEKLDYWVEDTEAPLVLLALEKAVLAGKRNFSYTDGILKNWTSQGIRTRKDAEIVEREFQRQKEQGKGPPPGAKKLADDKPLTPEEKAEIAKANAELRELTKQIGKEMEFP